MAVPKHHSYQSTTHLRDMRAALLRFTFGACFYYFLLSTLRATDDESIGWTLVAMEAASLICLYRGAVSFFRRRWVPIPPMNRLPCLAHLQLNTSVLHSTGRGRWRCWARRRTSCSSTLTS